MSIVQTIGRMLLGGSIRRALWRSPKALLVIAALVGLVLMSIGTARAQSVTLQQAGAQCQAWIGQQPAGSLPAGVQCLIGTQQGQCQVRAGRTWESFYVAFAYTCGEVCPVDAPWNSETGTCGTPNTCPGQPNLGNTAWSGYNAETFSICKDGCTYNDVGAGFTQIVDGVTYMRSTDWAPSGAQCTISSLTSLAPTDSDGDGTSDGFDGSPNNPGSGGGGGADGLGQPEDGDCGGEGQPACGDNGSGSGNGNTSGGGGSCAAPPSSTGDPILAQIAYQTWATRCAVEGLGKGTAPGSGDADGDGDQPDWTKGDPPPTPGGDDEADIAGAKKFGIGIGPSALNDTDIFGGGTCPQFSFQIAGTTISSAEYPQWCNVVAIMRALILIFGAFTALRILMGSE